MLSSAAIPSAPAGTAVRLRSGRGARAIFLMHASSCIACLDYARSLIAVKNDIAEWDGRLTIVLRESLEAATALHAAFGGAAQVLADSEGRLGLDGGCLVIADEWGEVHFSTTVNAEHMLPEPAEVVDWVRFTAIQCEECERPEGEWRSL